MRHSTALSLLLGFELSYYLLIVQTGLVEHYNSDLLALFPMFFGGVLGTLLAGVSWGKINKPIYKILIALSLQLILSSLYPDYNIFSLILLGVSVGMMAPLGIYLFKSAQKKELFVALAIAYSVGTYFFNCTVESRYILALAFSAVALCSSMMLRDYKLEISEKTSSHSIALYLPLVLWILLDSYLFETLLRDASLNIWSSHTLSIIVFHLLGLVVAYKLLVTRLQQHILIAILFSLSYLAYYFSQNTMLSIIYPFTISFYNIVIFTTLSKETSLKRLSIIMVFVGWIASGVGLGLALL